MKSAYGYGLLPTPHDARDFPFEKVFGAASPATLPREYIVSQPLVIKDQGDTDMCSAFALTAVSEDQERLILDPAFSFARTKRLIERAGGDPLAWGADLRSACKSATKKHGGFLPATARGYNPAIAPTQEERDAYARGDGMDKFEWSARKFAKQSFFAVSGAYDTFDNIRSAMWRARSEERSVLTGIDWNPGWNYRARGEVESGTGGNTYGHAIKLFGWSADWMLAQLSNGKEIGEGGIFKLHRNVVNEFCTYGSFTFMDLLREDAMYELGRVGWLKYWLQSVFA